MPRNGEDARLRLRCAALELFAENGFDETTAAEIAARAGVTERTFFRHFADKREVLFDGQNILGAALSEAIGRAPTGLPPMEVLHWAFAAVTAMLEQNRRYSEPRRRIISGTPALQEREVAKQAAIVGDVAAALQRRGFEKLRAQLAAQTGAAVLGYALECWFGDPSRPLDDHLERALVALQELSSPASRQ